MPTARPTSVRLRASLLAALFKKKTRHTRAALTPPQGVNATTPFAGTPWGRPVIYVADVDALYARARAAGLAPEFAPRDAGWGARRRRVPRRSRVRQLLVVLKKATRPSHGTAHSGERCFRSYSRRCQAIRPLYDATFRRALLPHHRPRRPRARVRAAAASAGRRRAAAAAMTRRQKAATTEAQRGREETLRGIVGSSRIVRNPLRPRPSWPARAGELDHEGRFRERKKSQIEAAEARSPFP